MNKQIHIEFDGRKYILEFTRKTVAQMERSGFRVDELMAKPMISLPQLFAGAFLSKHPTVDRGTINKIYAKLPNKEALIEALSTMYNEPINALLDEPAEGDVGNASWELV